MKRLIFVLFFCVLALAGFAQDLSISWPSGMSTEVYSNCGNVTIKVKVSNDGLTEISSYEVDCVVSGDGKNRERGEESEHPIAAGAVEDFIIFDAALNPGHYTIKAFINGTTDTIRSAFDVVYCTDVAVVSILDPVYPSTVSYIEGEPLTVKANFKNLGARAASGVYWHVVNVDNTPMLPAQTLPSMNHGDIVTDQQQIVLPMGYIGQQMLRVHLGLASDLNKVDNDDSVLVNILPAYNPKAVMVSVAQSGLCRMTQVPVSLVLVNDGAKPILAGDSIVVGYDAQLLTQGVAVSTLPLAHHETYHIDATWNVGDTLVVAFRTPANLYPTGAHADVSLSLTGWCHHLYDIVSVGDTTPAITVSSLHNPDAPVASNLNIPYATRSIINASQSESRPIAWYADSADAPFYAPSNYTNSTAWATPQYFADTVYYLMSVGANGCSSYYAPVHVNLMPRVPYDAGVQTVYRPFLRQVFTEDDTVRVKVCNYGTQPIADFPVGFSVSNTLTKQTIFSVEENMPTLLQPDQCSVYTFNNLLVIPTDVVNKLNYYTLKSWTAHASDPVAANDTCFDDYNFTTLSEASYCTPNVSDMSLLVSSVHYNTLANELSPIGLRYINFAPYQQDQRVVPAVHVTRGSTDSVVLAFVNVNNCNDRVTTGTLLVAMDFNRDGDFGDLDEVLHTINIVAGQTVSLPVTIPYHSHFGYMRMRLWLAEGDVALPTACTDIARGMVQDYLVYVDEAPLAVDVAATRIVGRTSNIVDTTPTAIHFAMANKGASALTSATVHYTYASSDVDDGGAGSLDSTFTWTGNLQPGQSCVVQLPEFGFSEGTTEVVIRVDTPADADTANNTIRYQLHRFHIFRCLYKDDFDQLNRFDQWYAPRGDYLYNRNLWQHGMPASYVINSTHSGSSAWATLLDTTVAVGLEGNMSYLYSPLLDVSISHPDSLIVYLHRNLKSGSCLRVEYLDANGNWRGLYNSQSVQWYSTDAGFTGNSDGGYQCRWFLMPTVQAQLGNVTQLRFVYYAERSNEPKNYNDGVALDDIRITHTRGAIDVGAKVVALATDPQIRRKVYPQVVVMNYGTDTICNFPVEYLEWGATEPVSEIYPACLAPGASDTFVFATPFVVRLTFPDRFHIAAQSVLPSDIYQENDSCINYFNIVATDDDLELVSFVSPRASEVASDTVEVTLRMCNNGSYPIESVPVAFNYNAQYDVVETVDFGDLLGGDGLPAGQCYNYTFVQPYHVSIGITSLYAYCSLPYDVNEENDTLLVLFDGLTNSIDLKAVDILLDTSMADNVRIQLTVRNGGARMVRNFTAGFYIDGDTSTLFLMNCNQHLSALSNAYIIFDRYLPRREGGYDDITAFVHVDDDIDTSNDTTTVISAPYVDLVAERLIVQDNQDSACKVWLRVQNVGNYPMYQQFTIRAIVNGDTIYQEVSVVVAPGASIDIPFDSTVAKRSDGSYQGSGFVVYDNDSSQYNNQTSALRVVSRYVGIANVDAQSGGLALMQNYPNPCTDHTFIPFTLSESMSVSVCVYDYVGRCYLRHSQQYAAGNNLLRVATTNMPAGVYFYTFQAADVRLTRRFVVR